MGECARKLGGLRRRVISGMNIISVGTPGPGHDTSTLVKGDKKIHRRLRQDGFVELGLIQACKTRRVVQVFDAPRRAYGGTLREPPRSRGPLPLPGLGKST